MATVDKTPLIDNRFPFRVLRIAPRSVVGRCARCGRNGRKQVEVMFEDNTCKLFNMSCFFDELARLPIEEEPKSEKAEYTSDTACSDDADDTIPVEPLPRKETKQEDWDETRDPTRAHPGFTPIPQEHVAHELTLDEFLYPTTSGGWNENATGKQYRYWPIYKYGTPRDAPVYYIMVWVDPTTRTWTFFAKPNGVEYRVQPELTGRKFNSRQEALRACWDRYARPLITGNRPKADWEA